MRVACVGGGPAGLYLSLLLARRFSDWEVRVYERDRADQTFGWGVVFSDATLERLCAADEASYRDVAGAFVRWSDIDVRIGDRTIRAGGHGFSGIARARLLNILQRHAAEAGAHLHFETEIRNDAALSSCDLVVVCDGASGSLRRDAFGSSVAFGECRYVWLGSTLQLDAFSFFFARTEHGWFAAHAYPHAADASTVIVECREETWRAHGLHEADTARTLAFCEALFADDLRGHRLQANVARPGANDWQRFARVENERWYDGNVVLLGDAAHTAHFSIGSGTKLAMEDAIALCDALAKAPDLADALASYESERRGEALRLQHAADNSARWFENVARYAALPPEQFAYSLLTRSQRVGHENLRVRDASYVEGVEAWFARRADASPRPPIFVPFRLREMHLRNRIALAPMDMYSAEGGVPNDVHLVHLGARALGGAGLIFTEMVCVSPQGRISPGCSGIYTDEQAVAWRRITAFVHERSEAKIALQLGHAGPKASTKRMWEGNDEPLERDNWPVVGPSAVAYARGHQVPRELDREAMDEIREAFVAAARRGDAAGFDMLELHCAHGYLLSAFLTPLQNHRVDEYGGSLANRLRYPLEVFRAVRAAWPAAKPISVRISATDWVQGGITGDDAVVIARAFAAAGADLIDVSTGLTSPDATPQYGRLFQTPFADRIRNEAGIATMAVGSITDAGQANEILAAGRADLIALGRAHLSDPAWTLHAAAELGYEEQWWPVQYLPGKAQLERRIGRNDGRNG